VAIVDPLGVWWGLRASADGRRAGYPVVVFGGRHADVKLTPEMGAPLGRMIATEGLLCIIDLSEFKSNAARRRFMAAFSEAIYEVNEEPLHIIFDEADLFAPQRPIKGWESLLGNIEEIVRRGRVRGFIPWLLTQRPAVLHKDVLSQARILIAMNLTSSQDRDAVGGWIEGQADRAQGKTILGNLPRLKPGEGYLWSPRHDILERVSFPANRTFDSSRTPKRGECLAPPRTLAEVDLSAITAALAQVGAEDPAKPAHRLAKAADDRRRNQLELERIVALEKELAEAKARIAAVEQQNRDLNSRLQQIASLASAAAPAAQSLPARPIVKVEAKPSRPPHVPANAVPAPDAGLHPAARKLLLALAQHSPARFTWGQAATLAGLKPSGGHFNAGRKELRASGFIAETNDLVSATPAGLKTAGEVPPAPSTPAERLALWCGRLPSPAPEMLRTLAAQREGYMDAAELADAISKKPTGGHWNTGIRILRNNGLIETDGRRYRSAVLFRE
jgi:hypothetical protein